MRNSLEAALLAWRREDAWEARLVARVGGRALLLFRREGEPQDWLELGHAGHHAGHGDGGDGGDRGDGGNKGGGLRAQREALKRLGLRRRRWADGATAWGRTLDAGDGELALHVLVRALLDLLGDARKASFEVLCQREPPPENPDLLAAMRRAAERQDKDTRRNLYAALVNATLLVPIDPATLDRPPGEQEPLAVEHDQGGPIWGAFSDWDALRQWQPTGHAFGPVHGTDFFAHAHEHGGGSVRINPGGFVGGELYAAEVAMMVEAVRRFYSKTMS